MFCEQVRVKKLRHAIMPETLELQHHLLYCSCGLPGDWKPGAAARPAAALSAVHKIKSASTGRGAAEAVQAHTAVCSLAMVCCAEMPGLACS